MTSIASSSRAAGLVLLLVATAVSASGPLASCVTCHADPRSAIKGQGRVLAKWLTPPRGEPLLHHRWVPRAEVRAAASLPEAFIGPMVSRRDAFFPRLERLLTEAADGVIDDQEAAVWRALVEEGAAEVPAFERVYWEPARRHLGLSPGRRAEALEPLGRSLQTPYSRLFLPPGIQLVYRQIHEVGTERVLFIKGSRKRFENRLTYSVQEPEGNQTRIELSLHGLDRDERVSARVSVDEVGRVLSFTSDPPDHGRARNEAARWLKPTSDRLDSFAFDRLEHLPPLGGRRHPPVTNRIQVEVRGFELYQGVPVILGEATLQVQPPSPLRVQGTATFRYLPRGVAASSEVDLRHSARVKGVTVKGWSRSRVELDVEASRLVSRY